MLTVREMIDLWPSVSDFARDLGLKRETHGTVMKSRGSIPVAYWRRMIEAAGGRGIEGISSETLLAAHDGTALPAANRRRGEVSHPKGAE